MNNPKIGELIMTPQHRDAIHVAIAPVVAGCRLSPGEHVGFERVGGNIVEPSTSPIGIIDPFLRNSVNKGQSCYLFLYPNTVTQLRHEWTHPAFGDEPQIPCPDEKQKARWQIEQFAERCFPYDNNRYAIIMHRAQEWITSGKEGSAEFDYYRDISDEEWDSFWTCYGIVTGQPTGNRGGFFDRCTC